MTGLAFPSDANFNREASYEDGTPISNGDDIPIDPALMEDVDPKLIAQENNTENVDQRPLMPPPHNHFHHQPRPDEIEIDKVRQYSQTPQGDPFAPEVPIPFLPYEAVVAEPPPPATKQKRKRRVAREEDCGFCSGTDQRNKLGQPERMLTCLECGRSGHPSCMELDNIGDIIRSYPWRCIECKICELCQEKGDDARLLFCDQCDRGWHMYCLVPPMPEAPDGTWVCPQCVAPGPPNGMPVDPMYPAFPGSPPLPLDDPAGSAGCGTSVASTSQSALQEPSHQPEIISRPRKGGRPPGKGKGGRKPRPKPAPPPEVDEDAMDVEEAAPVLSKSTTRTRTIKRSRTAREAQEEFSEDCDGEPASSPLRTRRRKQPKEPSPAQTLPRVRLRLPTQLKGKGKEREEEESNSHGMFDDILKEGDRDTSKTQISRIDMALFERSRQVAEDKLKPPPSSAAPPTTGRSTATASETLDLSTPGPSRPLRSAHLHHISTNVPATPNDLSASPVPSTPGPSVPIRLTDTNTLRIHTIRFGEYDIKTWYDAPFPEEYATIPDGRLWICEFCLKYMKSRFGALRHRIKCKARHPPGDEIYRDGAVSIFEVDGRRNKIYCQNLCLLSKMFLDHKSLFYDVEPFLFYVITEMDDVGYRFVGYFSKEKRSPKDYNVSCIMTLPVRQRKGWGNLLIDFSYLLSKKEERSGSPEKPLSNLGAIGYRKYWTLAVMRYLQHAPDKVRLEDIRVATSMTLEDICQTLTEQNMLYVREPSPSIRPSPGQAIKFPKGRKNGIARRQLQRLQTQDKEDTNKGPFVPPKYYEIHFDRSKVVAYVKDWERKGYLKLKPEKLQWTPYLLSRASQEGGMMGETPALASSSLEASSSGHQLNGVSPNGVEKREPSVELNLFSSPPPDAPEELGEEDELPMPRRGTRSRTRSPKKLSSAVAVKGLLVAEDVETPRRKRGRQSQAAANGSIFTPDTISASGTRRTRATRGGAQIHQEEDMEEEETPRHLRSSRSKPNLPAPSPPKKARVRKRRRDASPEEKVAEPEPEPEEKVADPEPEPEDEEIVDVEIATIEQNGLHINGNADLSEGAPSVVSEVNGIADEARSLSSEDAAGSIEEFVSEERVSLHVESDLRSTLLADDELGDEDAEGEDEDAEGEIDPDY
ncbi:hypothetical protein D9611_001573 [Ephemerocybe angulata]|uniref:Histone acetyltransferase n=1 Tax=Ephemerocybe angulata TaxID=980116 RepID=A0A8H5CHK7_9AGAR|nr:hypothetical protein D9611_001573 [Tulosesus angulatus]